MKVTALCPIIASLFVLPALQGHHGWAEFDLNREIKVEAIVIDFHFVNPHCVVEFEMSGDKVVGRRWQGEFSSPAQLVRKGWNAATLQPGDMLVLTGHPAKDGAPALYVQRIRMPDGKEVAVDGT